MEQCGPTAKRFPKKFDGRQAQRASRVHPNDCVETELAPSEGHSRTMCEQEREGHGFTACGKFDFAFDFGWRSGLPLR